MNGVLSASRLMKASEVSKRCKETRENLVLLLAVELEAKRKLYEMNIVQRREVS